MALDTKLVFVDAWALEWILDPIEVARRVSVGGAPDLDGLRGRARSPRLHRGELLGADEDDPSLDVAARRFRERVLGCPGASR